jgi:hypothetical protein
MIGINKNMEVSHFCKFLLVDALIDYVVKRKEQCFDYTAVLVLLATPTRLKS